MNDPGSEPRLLFLSEEWFARARELTADLPSQPDTSCRLQFDAVDDAGRHHLWHEVIVNGRVEEFAAGEISQADLVLHLDLDDARRLHRGELSGTEALNAIRVSSSGGGPVGRPSPLDIAETDELDLLPKTPGASLVIQYRFLNGPFGPVDYCWTFEDGRSGEMLLDTAVDPDVAVTIDYWRMVAVRCGDITVLEALEGGGQVEGGVGPLMLLAGLQESPELHAAELVCGPSGPVLATFARVTKQPQHRFAMATLAAETR